MASGAGNQLGAPMIELEVVRKQIYCIEESTCDIFVTFRRPRVDSASPVVVRRPGNCAPFPPSLRPCMH